MWEHWNCIYCCQLYRALNKCFSQDLTLEMQWTSVWLPDSIGQALGRNLSMTKSLNLIILVQIAIHSSAVTDRNPSLEPSFKWSITSINMVTSATRLTWMDVMLEVSRHHEVKTFQYNLHQQSHCAGTKFAMEGIMRLWLLLETQHYGVEVRLC